MSKRFARRRGRSSVRQTLIDKSRGQHSVPAHQGLAVDNVSVAIGNAEAVGVIGGNGSGKSTLLRLLAGIYQPTTGEVRVAARIAPVLELGTGFHRDLDGVENAVVYAAALGLTAAEVRACLPAVVEFSDLGEDIGLPLKHFSTGMQARLALSVALCSGFELLLLDEALSVCDRNFREKVEARLVEFQKQGGTYVFVSHDVQQVQRLCDRVVWMREGRVHADGPAAEIVEQYRASS